MNQPRLKLTAINQIGFVVKDLDKAMEAYWRNFGIGPWRIYTYGPPLVKQTTYRGRAENFHMRIALADVGGLMIELIQHLDGDTVYKEFVEKAGEGVQHLGIFVENLDRAIEEAQQAGFKVIQSGRAYGVHGDGGFAYLDTAEELGTIYELIEIPSVRVPPERVWPEQ
jgi:catechol 2,3-dioxygenase-like lactoylglutathione lyase family enzyme